MVNVKENVQLKFDFLSEDQVVKLRELLSYPMIQKEKTLIIESTIKELSGIIAACNQLGLTINDIQLQKVNLETIFLSLTGKQLRD